MSLDDSKARSAAGTSGEGAAKQAWVPSKLKKEEKEKSWGEGGQGSGGGGDSWSSGSWSAGRGGGQDWQAWDQGSSKGGSTGWQAQQDWSSNSNRSDGAPKAASAKEENQDKNWNSQGDAQNSGQWSQEKSKERGRSRSPRRTQGPEPTPESPGTPPLDSNENAADQAAAKPMAVEPAEPVPPEEPAAPEIDDPLVKCLPAELRPKVQGTDIEDITSQCRALRAEPWPELQLIGGAASGGPGVNAPDMAILRALSERLLCRLEEQTLSSAKPPPPGSDHVKLFVHGNNLGFECDVVLRRLPEAAKLRVMRAGPVVGHDREAVFLARVRRALEGLNKSEDCDLQGFIADNWIGTATERVLRGATVEVQKKVMQKGPLLGPCPQKELLLRLERLEAKAKKEATLPGS